MAKELDNLQVTGNELYPRDHVQDVHFGLESTRVFLIMTNDEKMTGTLLISLMGDVQAELSSEPDKVFEEFAYHTYSQSKTESITAERVDPKTHLGRSYKMSKKLTGKHEGYVDVVTNDSYYLKPTTNRADSEQRRQIEDLRLRSVQVSVNC